MPNQNFNIDFPPLGNSPPLQGNKRPNPPSPAGDSPESKTPRTDSSFSIPEHPPIGTPSIEKFKDALGDLRGYSIDKRNFPTFLSHVTHILAIASAIFERQESRILDQTIEIENLKKKLAIQGSDIAKAKTSITENVSKVSSFNNTISSLKASEHNRKISEELDLSNRSIKINNFPSDILLSSENPKSKIREFLESKGADSKNSMHDTSITILCNLKKHKDPSCPVMISCKNSSIKNELSKALSKDTPDLKQSFHFPSSIHKQVKMIRDKLSSDSFNIEDNKYDLKDSWILIRPTSEANRLKVFTKLDKNQKNWSFLTTLPIPQKNDIDLKKFDWGKIIWSTKQRV